MSIVKFIPYEYFVDAVKLSVTEYVNNETNTYEDIIKWCDEHEYLNPLHEYYIQRSIPVNRFLNTFNDLEQGSGNMFAFRTKEDAIDFKLRFG